MSLDDSASTNKSTVVILLALIVVCVLVLFSLLNSILETISPVLSPILNKIGYFIRVNTTNYNFPLPEYSPTGQSNSEIKQQKQDETLNDPPNSQNETVKSQLDNKNDLVPNSDFVFRPVEPNSIDYNFFIEEISLEELSVDYLPDAIIDDANSLLGLSVFYEQNVQNIRIQIPKININSPVLLGDNAEELLKQGFWMSPTSYPLGRGEVVMLCHRRHFGPYDPRSCWFLDKIIIGDRINLIVEEHTLKYQVVGVKEFFGEDPLIYSISPNQDFIKIVTCSPLYSHEKRLVVLARRVQN